MRSIAHAPALAVLLALAACAPEPRGTAQNDGTANTAGQSQSGVTSGGLGGSAGGGGTISSGGSTSSGGMTAIAGMTGSGGSTDSGGATATGGMIGSGGSVSSGGMTATGGMSATGGTTATGPTFHVFLLLGQSNMAGYPKAQPADRIEDERVRVLGYDNCAGTGRQIDEWDTAAPPLHECWNDAIGPGDHFAKTLIGVVPEGDTIGLVPCAISGERIETFLKVGGTEYNSIVERARLAQQEGGVIEGILFHQGESNNGDPEWPGKVNTLVTDLRTDLELGEVPFLAGELLYSGGTAGHNTQVNRLPGVVSNAFVISADGLVVDPADTQWNLHFGHDSQVTFGERYAEKMIEALGW